ncbi:hypothetical protein QR680_014423 [Steinernema hermaphroditum]|uniref:Uncharacterized protein n=1 Tax=Steinernema hermaphroditum TaxID=289476 RepID=A0AA39I8T4_9BILA|nr:hypothetical protein QR680_014423 [Steinernema hermaphroditum]
MQHIPKTFIDRCMEQSPTIASNATKLSGNWAKQSIQFSRNRPVVHIFIQLLPNTAKVTMASDVYNFEDHDFKLGSLQFTGQKKAATVYPNGRSQSLKEACNLLGGHVMDIGIGILQKWKAIPNKESKRVCITERRFLGRAILDTKSAEVRQYGKVKMEQSKDPDNPYLCLHFGY